MTSIQFFKSYNINSCKNVHQFPKVFIVKHQVIFFMVDYIE